MNRFRNDAGLAGIESNHTSFLGRVQDNLQVAVLILLMGLLAACGGGGSSSAPAPAPEVDTSAPESGDLLIGITDAEGDFVGYTVDVGAITLERANGDTVQALPLSTRIDFTELTEVTELLSLATVPAGNYETVTVELDFTDAEILVQDAAGEVQQANAVDVDGDPMGLVDVRLSLSTSDVIRIAPGRPVAFSLDFDLDASNTVDLTTAVPTVTVEPFLLAVPELEDDREHRARGVLASVDTADSSFELKVRPFRHRSGEFGRVTLQSTDATVYEIDGEAYAGTAGLDALAGLPENTPVAAAVVIIPGDEVVERGLQAQTVLAGSSVPWTERDVLKGVVTARVGDSVTVRGARIEFTDGTDRFRGEYVLEVGADTTVSTLGNDSLTLASVSVGQRIVAFGEVVDDTTFNANPGRVQIKQGQVTAAVVSADPLVVDLHYLNGRRLDIFDFSGTGLSAADDADPDNYEIDTTGLSLALETDDLIRARGLVNDFGFAAPDFNASTLIQIATDLRRASLGIGWPDGSATPFISTDPARLDVDLTDARVGLKQQGVPRTFSNPLEAVALVAPEDGMGAYAVALRGDPELHLVRDFAELVSEVAEQLDAGNLLHRISAHGRYNDATDEFTTGRAVFEFRPASQD